MPEQLHIEYEELTHEERLILKTLQAGRENARAVTLLAALVGVDHRRLRAVVKHLIEEHGALIGSATSSPTGYYLIDSVEEAQAVCDRLHHRGISILERRARLKKSIYKLFGQGEL